MALEFFGAFVPSYSYIILPHLPMEDASILRLSDYVSMHVWYKCNLYVSLIMHMYANCPYRSLNIMCFLLTLCSH